MFISVKKHKRILDHMNNREEELLNIIYALQEDIDTLLKADTEELIEYQLEHYMRTLEPMEEWWRIKLIKGWNILMILKPCERDEYYRDCGTG